MLDCCTKISSAVGPRSRFDRFCNCVRGTGFYPAQDKDDVIRVETDLAAFEVAVTDKKETRSAIFRRTIFASTKTVWSERSISSSR